MPRKARVEDEGAIYHVMDRGDPLEAIYRDERDREIFLKTLGEVCGRCGWRVHAYVLMENHFLLETPEPNLSRGMRVQRQLQVLAGIGEMDVTQGRNIYRTTLEKRAREERSGGTIEEGMLKALRRGWGFGSEVFRESILEGLAPLVHTEQGNSREALQGATMNRKQRGGLLGRSRH